MPRRPSLADEWDAWPKHIASAIGANRDWMSDAKCRATQGHPARRPWTVHMNEKVKIGRTVYTGAELIAHALNVCFACPVQWKCARFCMQTWENWGTWAMDVSAAKWLHRQPDYDEIIDASETKGVPIQVFVNEARSAARRQERAARKLKQQQDIEQLATAI